jgi:ubiquinone biosynthesis protein
MTATREPIRVRRPGRGALLNPALVPTPLLRDEERPPVAIAPSVARRSRLATVWALILLGLQLGALRLRGRLDPRTLGRCLSAFCLEMGVLWIKVGQLLSMRSDLLPREVIEELAGLQDRASGFDGAEAVKVIEEDLGKLQRVFQEFDATPFAAASVSQVHRGRLKPDGLMVAIKVRRPGIEQTFASDLAVLRVVVNLLRRFSIKPHFRWEEMLWEAELIIREELDYRIEATNQRRLRRSLARHDVYVPQVFTDLSSPRVLTMEYVPGVLMSDYLRIATTDRRRLDRWREANGIDTDRLARRMLRSFLRQLFEDNLFHSDLHPGNLLLLRDSRHALLDFGSLGRTESEMLRRYSLFFESLVNGQHATAVDVYLLFAQSLPPTDLTPVRQELVETIRSWHTRAGISGLSFDSRSATVLSDDLARILDRHGIAMNWAFLRIARAWATMDPALGELVPTKNLRAVIVRYLRRRDRRRSSALLRTLSGSPGWISPVDVPRLLYERNMFRGSTVRRLARVFEGSTTVASQVVAKAFGLLALAHAVAGVALVVTYLYQHHPALLPAVTEARWAAGLRALPGLDPQVWLVVVVVLAYGWRTSRRLRRQFALRTGGALGRG